MIIQKRKNLSSSSVNTPISSACVGLVALLATGSAAADCQEQIAELDQTYSSAGYMIGDESVDVISGYLQQSRSFRDTALIMLSTDREEECIRLIEEAQILANKASMPSIFPADALVGREVTDVTGQDIGNIENVMIDLDRGVVAYALVSFGGFIGIGEDLVPVPFGMFSLSLDGDKLELAARQETIANAPRYIEGEDDLLSRRSWAANVYQYYGENPYWTEQRRDRGKQRGNSRDSAARGSSMSDSQTDTTQTGQQAGVTDDTSKSHQDSVEAHDPIQGFNDLIGILDADASGTIDKNEAAREFVVLKHFSSIDEDSNGEVDSAELVRLAATHEVSADGQTLIPISKDAKPEEAWTGGKLKKEAAAD